MRVGFLLGNTSLRVGFVEGRRLVSVSCFEWSDADRGLDSLRSRLTAQRPQEAVAASVRDDLLARLEEALGGLLPPLRLARRDFPIPIPTLYERPEDAGADRLLGTLAARHRLPGKAAIVVDWGSAISVSVLTRAGEFGGGLIACGTPGLLAGLRAATPRLPLVAPGRRDSCLQRSTQGALEMGLYCQLTGGVRSMLVALLSELGEPRATVLATGGDAGRLSAGVAEIDQVVPNLTLEGLFLAAYGDLELGA